MIALPFIILAFIHWLADFLLQWPWMKSGKSTSLNALTMHVGMYTLTWAAAIALAMQFVAFPPTLFYFLPITFVCHWVTDFFTSRLNKRLWDGGKVNFFFNSIGFDQWLHYLQIFLTYSLFC